MKTTFLKNTFLIASGIMLATSFSIFAIAPSGTTIQANLTNLIAYLAELHITSDGTPNGTDVLSIDRNGETRIQSVQGGESTAVVEINSTLSTNSFQSQLSPWVTVPFAGSSRSDTLGNTAYVWVFDFSSLVGGVSMQTPWLFAQNASGAGSAIYLYPNLVIGQTYTLGGQYGASINISNNPDPFNLNGAAALIAASPMGSAGIQAYADSNATSLTINNGQFYWTWPTTNEVGVLTSDGNGTLRREEITGDEETVLSTSVGIPQAQLLDIGTNPVELISSPGEGSFIQVLDVTLRYIPGATPYTLPGQGLVVYQGNDASEYLFNFGVNIDTLDSFFGVGYDGSGGRTVGENEAVKLSTQDFTNPTDGDGALEVYLTYKVVSMYAPAPPPPP